MADDAQDPGADVEITADTSGWEQALDRAKAAVNGWSDRVSDRFARTAEAVRSRTEAIAGAVASIREKAADTGDLAGSVGSVLGGLAGTAIGGPIGTAIGASIGSTIGQGIGDAIDFEGIVSRFEELTPVIRQTADSFADDWEGAKFTVKRVLGEIGDLVRGLDLGELFSGSTEDVTRRFEDLGNQVGDKLRDMVGQVAVRIADLIDSTFAKFQEPVAQFIDFIQRIAVELGIVDESTTKWGDSIRELKDVGIEAMAAIARGVGYATDALRVAGGAVAVAYVQPFLNGLSIVTKAIADQAKLARDVIPAELGGGAGGVFDKVAQGADKLSDRLQKVSQKAGQFGVEQILKGLEFKSADEFEKWLRDNRERLRDLNRRDDEARRQAPQVPAPDVPVPAVERAAKSVAANILGSAEGRRALIADQLRAAGKPADPQVKAAAAAEKAAAEAPKQTDQLKKIAENTKATKESLEGLEEE